jgi:hypothetical protein
VDADGDDDDDDATSGCADGVGTSAPGTDDDGDDDDEADEDGDNDDEADEDEYVDEASLSAAAKSGVPGAGSTTGEAGGVCNDAAAADSGASGQVERTNGRKST